MKFIPNRSIDENEIRFQGWYGNGHSFIGVCYLKLSELKG